MPVNLTEKLALYLTHSLSNKLGSSCSIPTYGLSLAILQDCEMVVAQAYQAYLNPSMFFTMLWPSYELSNLPVHLPWSIEAYSACLTSSQNIGTPRNEAEILSTFPPLFCKDSGGLLPLQDRPCTIVDSTGIIVLWYLPDALTNARNVSISYSNLTLY